MKKDTIPDMDTLSLIAKKKARLGLMIDISADKKRALRRESLKSKAQAAGPMKQEITSIAPKLLKEITAVREVRAISI